MNNMNLDYVTLHYRSVLNDFSNQFSNEEFSDCVLNAEGKSLKVHKAMLCAQSSFLEKIVLEHQSIGDLCFIVEGVPFEDLKSVVQFMYNGSTSLTKKKVGSFLVVAELLGVKWLDRIQLLSDTDSSQALNMDVVSQTEPKASSVVHDSVTETQSTSIPTPSPACSVFKNLTNVLDSNTIKRKKHMKNKKHCKKSKCAKEDHKHDKKRHKINHARHAENVIKSKEKAPGKETHLADMDESTFCTTLGLKKNNEVQPRELSTKSDSVNINSDAKIVPKSRSVPPLIKINREVKSNVESAESRDSNLFVSEINTVYIEDKNLSFINIGANELCIRENNIEIECDVLEASSSQFVIEKETSGNIVEIREDNLIQAEFVDINPEDSSSYSDSTRESVKKARPSRKKSNGKKSLTIDKSYFEGSTLFWCDVCQRTYHTKTGLNQHKRYECCKEPAFACPRCEKRFKRKSSLVRHAITLHDEAIFPTRTKLLSKLTSQGDRSILTISGKR